MGFEDPLSIVEAHDGWRSRCLNLIPSENVMSHAARSLLASDMVHRYTLPGIREMDGRRVENAYRGTRYMDEVESMAGSAARRVFDAKYACVRPISGHISAMISLSATCERGDTVMAVDFADGGYPGYSDDQLSGLLGLKSYHLPYDQEACDLDYEQACLAIEEVEPDAVVLGASKMLFPPDTAGIRRACDEVGSRLLYDGSHVLGLIAGRRFGDPLHEGVDLLFGSTHKTLFGPQGGITLTNDETIDSAVESSLHWRTIDNAHWNRIASLAQALMEMEEFGPDYAAQVVSNARNLARSLDEIGFPVQCGERGYTDSHQVGLAGGEVASRFGESSFEVIAKRLERADIIIDCVGRLGTCEVTRLGMKEAEMEAIAELVGRVLIDGESPDRVREEVHRLRSGFESPVFCFD
jgi:glycine hydroxymethyltransferase